MGQIVLDDNPLDGIILRRSNRARRMTLRVSQIDGKVTLTLPDRASEREASAFLKTQRNWLDRARSRVATPETVQIGGALPFEGRSYRIVAGQTRRPLIVDDTLRAPERGTAGAIKGWLKARARAVSLHRIEYHAARINRPVGRLSLRDTRSRWGSCSSDGNLMLSWRLIMAPPDVLDYVVAHEVAHLAEMNHSAAFWSVVAGLCPDYEAPRAWLRAEGTALHRFRFD